jgi:hypothetical protein
MPIKLIRILLAIGTFIHIPKKIRHTVKCYLGLHKGNF